MGVCVGVSWSHLPQPYEAAQEAATLAMSRLGDEHCDLALVFASPRYSSPELLEGIRSVTGRTPLIGTTNPGCFSEDGLIDQAVSVMLVRCEGLELRPGAGDRILENPLAAGRAVATQAREGRLGTGQGAGSLFLAFADATQGTAEAVLEGMRSVLGVDFPIVGAATIDLGPEQPATQYCLTYQFQDSVVGFLLGGPVRFGVGAAHGWVPVSRQRKITQARGSMVGSIDDAPALEAYRSYFPERFAFLEDSRNRSSLLDFLGRYPLGFAVPGEPEPLLRSPAALSDHGALRVGGDLAEGTLVRLMLGSRDGILRSARVAAEQAVACLHGAVPRGVIVFSSASRGRILGREAGLEMSVVREVCGEGVPVIGCYTHGEMSPARGSGFSEVPEGRGHSLYRNNSIVVLALADAVPEVSP